MIVDLLWLNLSDEPPSWGAGGKANSAIVKTVKTAQDLDAKMVEIKVYEACIGTC